MDTPQIIQRPSRQKTAEAQPGGQTPIEKGRYLLAQAQALHADEPRCALSLAEQALALAETTSESAAEGLESAAEGLLADCFMEVGVCLRWLTRYDEAITHLNQALLLSRASSNLRGESHCLGEIALVRAYQADYPAQIENALLALSLAQATGDESRTGKLLQYVGIGYSELGDYAAALPYYRDGLAEAERVGRKSDLSYALYNIAALYRLMGDPETGLLFSEKCLLDARQSETPINEAGALCQISEYLSEKGAYEQALAASQKALVIACRIRQTQPSAELNACQAQGQAFLGMQRWPEAVACFQEALNIARSSQDQRYESVFLQQMALAYRQQGRHQEARTLLEEALAAAEQTQAKQHVYTAHRDLARLCKQEGDIAGALTHAEAYHAVEREVRTAEADNRAKALSVRMQVEQAQQQAELHRLRNVELAQANDALEKSNSTLERANERLQEQAELLQKQARELRAQAEELQRQATQDGLTGLANRRFLESTLARQFSEAQHSGTPLTVVMADIDHFKDINDRFGHQVGDEVLMTVARLFQDACRTPDVIARYGGEEFALSLPGVDVESGAEICERVRVAIQGHAWAAIHSSLRVTVSLGLSGNTSVPSHERLLGLADEQLYRAKRGGRNRVCSGSGPRRTASPPRSGTPPTGKVVSGLRAKSAADAGPPGF